MMNAISTRTEPPAPLSYDHLERLAASIAASGLFGLKTKDQAIALMMIAHAEGRHPALAARDYDIIGGRPAKKSEAMLRDFLEGGGKVQWHALDDSTADATFTHPAGGSVRINWNMERAQKAGLATKENYKKFARQMLRSRTVSEGVRTVYPLATSGMYVPEEAADIAADTFTGQTLEAKPEPPAPKPRRKPEPEPQAAAEPEPPALETWLEKYANKLTNERSLAQFSVTFADACATASNQQDLVKFMGIDIVKRAFDKGSPELKEQLNKASSSAFTRLTPPAGAQPALDIGGEPWDRETGEITPADRLASG